MKYLLIAMSILTMFNSAGKAQDALSIKDISYRPPALAGSFYPANPDSLRAEVIKYLNNEQPFKISDEIIAMAVPHAGYVYSGVVAGKAYRELQGRQYDAVVVVGPSHRQYFKGSSVYNGEAYVTPLGNAMVDRTLAKLISDVNDDVLLSDKGHTSEESSGENSIETQIPFLQTVLPGVPIVPIAMGNQDYSSSDNLMQALVGGIRKYGKRVLLVASTDLSHYHNLSNARELDRPVVETFAKFDYFKLSNMLFSRKHEACGSGPLVAVLMAAEQLGANFAKALAYQTSANSPAGKNNKDRVVGYFSGLLVKNSETMSVILPDLTDDDILELKEAAKRGIKLTIDSSETMPVILIPRNLSEEFPAFVTLKIDGKLRGCMGHTFTSLSLLQEVEESARLAAESDPRFGKVRKSEIDSLSIEITIMSKFTRMLDYSNIQPGVHGVYLRLGSNSGLFLPQVASEQGWDRQTLLEMLGLKAGLTKDAYMNPKAQIFTFTAKILH